MKGKKQTKKSLRPPRYFWSQSTIKKKLFLKLGISALAAGKPVLVFTEENAGSAPGARLPDLFRFIAAYFVEFMYCH